MGTILQGVISIASMGAERATNEGMKMIVVFPETHCWMAGLARLQAMSGLSTGGAPKLGGQHVGEGHELLRLVGGVAEHVALVTSADLLQGLGAHAVDSLPDIWGLRLDVHQHLRPRRTSPG